MNRFNNDFFVDLVFTPSIDSEGKEMENNMDPDFWNTVLHRSPKPQKSPKERMQKVVQPISLFSEPSAKDKNSNEEKNQSAIQTPTGDDEFFQLEEYVKGLDHTNDELHAESDNDGDDVLLERLKHEMDDPEIHDQSKAQSPSSPKEAEQLDDDVQAILSQLE
jgi:hypothetical protein